MRRKILPFVDYSSYFFPSFCITSESWRILRSTCNEVIDRIIGTFAKALDQPKRSVFYAAFISNIGLNRAILKVCNGVINNNNAILLKKNHIWESVICAPYYDIQPLCVFCNGLDGVVSNLMPRRIAGCLVTVNDLSPDVVKDVIVVPRPRLFRHPSYELFTIWNSTGFDSPLDHTLDYEDKLALRRDVIDSLPITKSCRIVYFHHTLNERKSQSSAGWHAHVTCVEGGHLRLKRGNRQTGVISWCDYVILCSGFTWIMKIVECVMSNHDVSLNKFSELPYPLADVYGDLKDVSYGSFSNFGHRIICLQLMILSTCMVPTDILVSTNHSRWRDDLWNEVYKFLARWDYEQTPWHLCATAGRVYLHPLWLTIGEVDGDEFAEWIVATKEEISGFEQYVNQ
jgi:hypothetical protein